MWSVFESSLRRGRCLAAGDTITTRAPLSTCDIMLFVDGGSCLGYCGTVMVGSGLPVGIADKTKHSTVVRAPTTGTSIVESTVVVCRKREDLNAEGRGHLVSGRKCIVRERNRHIDNHRCSNFTHERLAPERLRRAEGQTAVADPQAVPVKSDSSRQGLTL